MKTIRLFCECGARRLFSASTTDDLITSIDASGWSDRAYSAASKRRVRGECEGQCPTCAGDGEAAPENREAR